MCGLLGTVYGTKERQPGERAHLKWLFTHLLVLSERRGPYATGIAWLKQDGSHHIFKRPVRARQFVKDGEFLGTLSEVDDTTTWLAGHTRWPTRGSHLDNKNNHPISVGRGRITGTHNGTVTNCDALFRRFKLSRFAQVDSEIIFRMADDTLRNGHIDIPAFKERLALCRGQISAVLASKLDPKTIVVIKGNMPLELRYSEEHHAVIYASDPAYLDVVVPPKTGWRTIVTKPMSIATFRCDEIPDFEVEPFTLAS